MSIPEWLSDESFVPAVPPHPDLEKAIQRYRDHFGTFDLNTVDFPSDERIIETIDICIKINKSFWEWHGKDPDVLYS